MALYNLKMKERFQQVMFSCRIRKFNKRFKSSDRAFLISESAMYKLDGKTFKPKKGRISLSEVSSVSVSSADDHLLVVHLKSNNDLAVSLQPDDRYGESRVGEAVGVLVQLCTK